MSDIPADTNQRTTGLTGVNIPLFVLTGGFIVLFCLLALFSLDLLSSAVDVGFAWSAKYFGLYWQLLLLATFFMGLIIAILPGGKAIMGGLDKPEFTTFQWGSMIMCTLLAGGGVFWAAGEPMAHLPDRRAPGDDVLGDCEDQVPSQDSVCCESFGQGCRSGCACARVAEGRGPRRHR